MPAVIDLTPALTSPRLEYSDFQDHQHGTVLQYLNSDDTPQDVRDAFNDAMVKVLAKINRHEFVDVRWWHDGYLYINVRDERIKHYPCRHRFLISFDVRNGKLNSTDSQRGYCFARKGWRAFAARISQGRNVGSYSECENPTYIHNCNQP